MLKGRPYKGARALQVGLIDELVPPAKLRGARQVAAAAAPPKNAAPFVDNLLNLGWVRPCIASRPSRP